MWLLYNADRQLQHDSGKGGENILQGKSTET